MTHAPVIKKTSCSLLITRSCFHLVVSLKRLPLSNFLYLLSRLIRTTSTRLNSFESSESDDGFLDPKDCKRSEPNTDNVLGHSPPSTTHNCLNRSIPNHPSSDDFVPTLLFPFSEAYPWKTSGAMSIKIAVVSSILSTLGMVKIPVEPD